MKTFFIILVITGILMQGLSKAIILIEFELNRDFIAQNLCVQKKVKNNCCKGKCLLTKELKADDEKEQVPGNGNFKFKTETELFIQSFISLVLMRSYSKVDACFPYMATLPTSFSASVFHPPCSQRAC